LSLVLGLLLSGLTISILRGVVGRTLRIESLIQQRTLELRESNAQLEQQMRARVEIESALSESLAVYQSLIESLPLNVFRKDLAGTIVDANQRFCDTIGHTMEETIGKNDFDLFPRAQAQKYRDDDNRVTQSGEVLEDIEEHVKNDGDRLYVQVLKAPARDAKGQIVGVQGMFWDVTSRVIAEEARRLSDAKFRRLVESDIIGVMIASLDGRILEANDEFLRIIAYSRQELDACLLRWDTQTPDEYRHLDDLAIQQLEETGACRPWEKEYLRKDGSRIAVLIGIAAIDHSSDECICWVLDITDRKRMEDELKRAKEAADLASEAKSQFLANMSHEIRTPMNAVIGMTELVLQSSLTTEQKDYLRMVLHSGESLLAVINDILDFSKVEAGKLEIDAKPFDFFDTIGDTMKSLALRAHAKQIELACDIAPTVPTMLIGDSGRIRQVVLNLVGNAIKFTQQGEVVLSVEVEREDQQEILLHFEVRDTGVGIPLAKQEQVFAAFEQADATMTRQFGGTGLGLAIAKRLVELMSGRLWVDSVEGTGSTFHFTVLLDRCSDVSEHLSSENIDIAQATVLIVDDSSTNRQIMSRILSTWRVGHVTADGVTSALERLGSHEPKFDVVIVDADMPGEDGFVLVRQMRTMEPYADTPVVLLTSGELPYDRQQEERPSVSAQLLKPVKQSELYDTLVHVLSSPDATHLPPPPHVLAAKMRPLKILMAEDSAVNQMLARALLEQHDHTVTVAHNGREAVQLVASMDFDLVLMDVQMPIQDGLEATADIRRWERSQNKRPVPIVALTAHAMKGDREKCLNAGMDEYLSKPIRAVELYATIKRAVLRFDSHDAVSESLSTDTTSAQSPAVKGPPFNSPGETLTVGQMTPVNSNPNQDDLEVSWDDALKAVNGNEKLLCELTALFMDEGPRLLQEVDIAVRARDQAGLKLAAHTLKGSARYFGGNPVYELASAIEKFAHDGQLDAAAEPLAALQASMPQLLHALDLRYSGDEA
jgi:PAS domain S-box-containing protein